MAFNDVHVQMAAGIANDAMSQSNLADLEAFAGTRGTDNAEVTREVGLPTAKAIRAFAKGEYSRCADLLLPV